MSGQVTSVTASPNHWWEISWASVKSSGAESKFGFVCDSSA
jgi:hypothetical protein